MTRIWKGRRSFPSGAEAQVVLVRAERLEPVRLHASASLRAREMAHILGARFECDVLALALPPVQLRAGHLPADLRVAGSQEFLSLRSALAHAFLAGPPGPVGRPLAGTRLEPLWAGLRRRGLVDIAFHRGASAGRQDGPIMVVPVGSLGFPRQVGTFLPGETLVNSHFFVVDRLELDSPHAAAGDPVGLLAMHGRVQLPPVSPRAALIQTAKGWGVRRLGPEDVTVLFPCGERIQLGDADPARLYVRGPRLSGATTPRMPDAVELCLRGRWPVAIASGGGLSVPYGGLVLSWKVPPPTRTLRLLGEGKPVAYCIPSLPDLRTAVQAGPRLIQNGQITLDAASFGQEEFYTGERRDATAPVVFADDVDETHAARVGVGVTREGSLLLVAVEGASTLFGTSSSASQGCTLADLATLLLEEGAVDALNFDGGGSTQAFCGAGALVQPADTRRVPGAAFDRPVPIAVRLQ